MILKMNITTQIEISEVCNKVISEDKIDTITLVLMLTASDINKNWFIGDFSHKLFL